MDRLGEDMRRVGHFAKGASLRLLSSLCAIAIILASLQVERAQVRSPYDDGAFALGQLLVRLQTTASALHTGAHPDDEDSALIARLARGDGARVAYLALNRGEGGQNIIGPELFETLGVIRTEELLQARRLDGGEQFFTRAFDFGFTKTRAEAAARWGEREILADMVRVIRLFRPLVIIARFTGTPADGHGQHQLAGYLTPLAFRLAADPKAFPEQLAEGLRPWRALKIYVSEGFRRGADPNNRPTLLLDTGRHDELLGRSYFEIAMYGRSQHKSQEMGTLELLGPQTSGVRLLESAAGASDERSVFDGIDVTIRGIAQLAGIRDASIIERLGVIQDLARRALREFDAMEPRKLIPILAEGLRRTRELRASLRASGESEDAKYDADFLLAQKEAQFAEALWRAAAIRVDALADDETVVAGDRLNVTARVFLSDERAVEIKAIRLRAPAGWRSEEVAPESNALLVASEFEGRETPQHQARFRITVPDGEGPTMPYWLREPRDGDLFRWTSDAPKSRPFDEPLVSAEVEAVVGGEPVTITAPVQYRYADPVRGEIRREINVVPMVSVALDPELVIVPTSAQETERRVFVRLSSNASRAVNGRVSLHVPNGWRVEPASAPFALERKGEKGTLVFTVRVPGGARADAYRISAEAEADGRRFTLAEREISYPHIQTHRVYAPAQATFRVLDLKVAPVRVGYIMGSGDRVPEAIRQMGLDVTLLNEDDLAVGDLARFDVIVVGIRASQVRPDFVANNRRLLDYVRQGGTLIVQYQRPDYVERGLAPFPAKMAARVTDENAPVKILVPDHPAFNFPNKITADDWRGWVQERSLYNFTTYDARYVPLLESHDAGEPPQTGGEVYAEIGRGKYVYTSYAWFRQLPAGVPGAYRLFANLLSLAKAPSRVERSHALKIDSRRFAESRTAHVSSSRKLSAQAGGAR